MERSKDYKVDPTEVDIIDEQRQRQSLRLAATMIVND